MTDRRTLLQSLCGAAAASAIANAQSTGTRVQVVHRQPLPAPFSGWEAEFVSVTMVPGPGSPTHSHNGFVLGYVVDGAFRFAIDDQAARVLKAGEAFYEPPGARHTTSASADPKREATILAIIISEKKAHAG